ncbi:hypothetical protein [Bacillus niameyensis]|uniref:hypothetical protein n=1 Tax=Bacillus niameyensis TaxID=1522308 RepID=UPI000781C723|nr:hypothetical protein [Bacillus niameyensis]
MLTKRDIAIISNLNKFRVMDRDSIAELHFSNLKNPSYAANNVLLRLLREGHISRSTTFIPYVYFGSEVQMKRDSAKIGHFLAILEVYKEIRRLGQLDTFLVEPKFGKKGMAEPDIYCEYRKTPFFIEVQKSIYSEKQMQDKLNRYVDLFESKVINPFPRILILSEQRYAIDDYPFKIFQSHSFTYFLSTLKQQTELNCTKVKKERGGVKIKIG